MAGALTHILSGLLTGLIVHIIHFRLEFSLSIFIGSLLHDVLKFGLTAIKQLTLNIFGVNQDGFYKTLNVITSDYSNWFTAGFFLFALTAFLYHYHYIKKKKIEQYNELYIFLIIGIIIHLVLDALIIEKTSWI